MLLPFPQYKEWQSWVEVDGKVTSCDPFSAPPECSFSIRFNATDGNEYGIDFGDPTALMLNALDKALQSPFCTTQRILMIQWL